MKSVNHCGTSNRIGLLAGKLDSNLKEPDASSTTAQSICPDLQLDALLSSSHFFVRCQVFSGCVGAGRHNKAMHAELRWFAFTLNLVTRRNRVIAVVSIA
jgi:hypothetical protein